MPEGANVHKRKLV